MLCRYIITLQALFQYKVLILPTLGKTTEPSDRMLIIDPIQKWEQPKFSESGRVSGGRPSPDAGKDKHFFEQGKHFYRRAAHLPV